MNAIRDENNVPVALGVDSTDSTATLPFKISPVTGGLVLDSTGIGTVTSVSVVSANGFAGTVATATTTPAITISTPINTPVLAGNGTALIAATTTGSGSTVVLATSPVLVTPVLGVASGTSIALSSKILTYNNVATAGLGVPAVYGIGRSTAQVAAVASVATYTVGAADGSFLISANVNVTTSTTHNFGVVVTYTDETNTSRSLTLPVAQLAGTVIAAITNITGAGPYEGVGLQIKCKAGTAITITTSGTFTSVVYNVEGSIIQIA